MACVSSMDCQFQSTLPRRERPIQGILNALKGMFQSTLPRRERHIFFVSESKVNCFNPRSREGSDGRNYPKISYAVWFQSTLPRRERPLNHFPILMFHVFQSTLPRRERRLGSVPFRITAGVSIHAPAKGATLKGMSINAAFLVSIHAPAKGATFWYNNRRDWLRGFNPRSREGSDRNFSQKFIPIFSRNQQIIILYT